MKNTRVVVVALGLLAGVSTAATFEIPALLPAPRTPAIDLDLPGALEVLEREHPDRYREVMIAVEKARKLPPLDQGPGLRNAFLDPRAQGAQTFLPTYPAKKHIFVIAGGVEYKVSAFFTDDPARIQKAR